MKYIVAAAFTLLASPALAGSIIFDIQITKEYTLRKPVAAIAAIPGKQGTEQDFYKAPGNTSADPELWANQCWFDQGKTIKTGGTQGADGLCIANGTLASSGNSAGGIPGRAYAPGLYVSGWLGAQKPLKTWDEHDGVHPHFREE